MSDLNRLLVLPWKSNFFTHEYENEGCFWSRSNTCNQEIVHIVEEIDNRTALSENKPVYYISFFGGLSSIWADLDLVSELDAEFDSFERFDSLEAAKARADGILKEFGFRSVPPETVCLM